MKTNNSINLRSDEIKEIMGIPPRWIVRWGISVIFVVIALVIVGSAFFTYPDIVTAPVIITSQNPPSSVIARVSGKPDIIFFNDGSLVNTGDTLAVIENPAKYKDIFNLNRLILKFDIINVDNFLSGIDTGSLILGEVQPAFINFSKACNDYSIFKNQKLYELKIRSLEEELRQTGTLYERLLSQKNLVFKDLKLTQKQFARDSQLYKTGVIAEVDFEKAQSLLIGKRQSYENIRLSLSNTTISMERLKQSITDAKLEMEYQRKKLTEDLQNSFNQLKSSLSGWEKTYLLIAPSSGKLTYMSLWSKLQEVKPGEKVFTINPENRGEIQARVIIPFARAGKVKPGQRVNMKLDAYPFLEYGMVEGEVLSISGGSVDAGFPAVISLKRGAVTSYGKSIDIERELTGIAEITTENLTIIQRLISPLKHLFKNYTN